MRHPLASPLGGRIEPSALAWFSLVSIRVHSCWVEWFRPSSPSFLLFKNLFFKGHWYNARRALALIGFVMLAAANSAVAAADQPVPRTKRKFDAGPRKSLLAKAKRGGIDLYFVGDSITRRWGTSDTLYADMLANWRANFFRLERGRFRLGRRSDRAHPLAA